VLLTALGYETIAPLEIPVRTDLRWDPKGRAGVARSFLSNELRLRAIARSGRPILVAAQLYGLATGESVLGFVHAHEGRDVLGSQHVGRAQAWLARRGVGALATHGEDFTSDGNRYTWPHPVGPASWNGIDVDIAEEFPGVSLTSIRLLVFGRAAYPDGLRTIGSWVSQLSRDERDAIEVVVAGRPEPELARLARLCSVRTGPARIADDVLDSVIRQCAGVLVPHSTHPRTLSGLMVLAAAHDVPAILGPAVNPNLCWPAPRVWMRGAEGIAKLVRNPQQGRSGTGEQWDDDLAEWGRRFMTLTGPIWSD
jgi:hypothetical protein